MHSFIPSQSQGQVHPQGSPQLIGRVRCFVCSASQTSSGAENACDLDSQSFQTQSQSDWFRSGHMIQTQPMRFKFCVETIGKKFFCWAWSWENIKLAISPRNHHMNRASMWSNSKDGRAGRPKRQHSNSTELSVCCNVCFYLTQLNKSHNPTQIRLKGI